MKLEDLLKKGLTEDQAKEVLRLHKAAIDGNYVPKQTFEAEREKVKTANETIADRDKQIAELGKFKGTAEELQQKVDTLTTENANARTEYENKLKKMEIDSAVRSCIVDKVHSVDDVLPRLDVSKLTITDGKVTGGLDDQIEAIKKTHPHYFKEVKPDPGSGVPAGWFPFGKSPDEGRGKPGDSSEADFGKSLAKAQLQGMSSSEKASDIYFK